MSKSNNESVIWNNRRDVCSFMFESLLFCYFLLLFPGIGFIICSVYVLFLERRLHYNFLFAAALDMLLIGIITVSLAVLGYQGILYSYQYTEIGPKIGRSCMIFQRILLILLLGVLIVAFLDADSTFEDFQANLNISNSKNWPKYNSFEIILASIFNDLYFTAVSSLDYSAYADLWRIVDHYCLATVNDKQCLPESTYSITACMADYSTCYHNGSRDPANIACPFNACRSGFWTYSLSFSKAIKIGLILTVAFTCLMIILSFIVSWTISNTDKAIKRYIRNLEIAPISKDSPPPVEQQYSDDNEISIDQCEDLRNIEKLRYLNQSDPPLSNSPKFSHTVPTSDRIFMQKSQSQRSTMIMSVACPESFLPSNSFENSQNNDSFYGGGIYTFEMNNVGDDCHKVDYEGDNEVIDESFRQENHNNFNKSNISIYNTSGYDSNIIPPSAIIETNPQTSATTSTINTTSMTTTNNINNNGSNGSNMARIFNLPNYLLSNISKVNPAKLQSRSFDYSNIYEPKV